LHDLVSITGLTKFYGGVRALSDVDLTLNRGEVVALVGDNGAGKSTLVKLLAGTERPDSGEIRVEGAVSRIDSSRSAVGLGIHTVYQDLSLCDNLDAVRNLFLGQEEISGIWTGRRLRRADMEAETHRILGSLSVKLRSLNTPVGRLSGGQRQGIAIGRALVTQPKLVLLDEPTAALGVSQRAEVLALIRRLKDQEVGVMVISHDLRDVQEVADRVVVLRLGEKVAEFTAGTYTSQDLVAAITGAHESVAGGTA
jgi:D-xylose transport system ATP-binding protein